MKKQIQGQISLFDLSAKMGLKRHYPANSLIAIDGCDYDDCFSCAGIRCQIREEKRYCRSATLGNPYPCQTVLAIDENPEGYSKECQFINQNLAYHRAGDHQPSPCCRECDRECDRRCEKSREESGQVESEDKE